MFVVEDQGGGTELEVKLVENPVAIKMSNEKWSIHINFARDKQTA